ncbi:flavodoxin [Clostridium sp. MCC353]|nr:flavodoxin [Clostridium sp. MCC353]
MLTDTTTPDGYQVNGDGAWVSANGVETRAAEVPQTAAGENVLIVYFSRTGTTERAAERIGQLTGGRLVELEAADPYNGSYDATLDRAERELNSNARPAITTAIDQMETYDTVFVGYPIWWGDAPMLIDTFLESYDFTGKTIVPFCTSGSSGISTSIRTIRGLCPNSTVLDGIRVGSISDIEPWLGRIGY